MDSETRNLRIAFQLAAPEDIIRISQNRSTFCPRRSDQSISSEGISWTYYNMTFRKLQTGFSMDEIKNRYDDFQNCCGKRKDIPVSIFQLLVNYSLSVLEYCSEVPVVKRERLMDFREISLNLGQDIFTMAYLAYKTVKDEIPYQAKFDWNKVINTNDRRLQHILQEGIAENHFHLAGSAPLFFLSWISVMNHPQMIGDFFGTLYNDKDPFVENRQVMLSFSNDARPFSWSLSLRYAAYIRAALFQKIYNIPNKPRPLSHLDPDFSDLTELNTMVMNLRTFYGKKFPQADGTAKCLDYAVRKNSYYFDIRSENRMFCGEREFLYRCFMECFKNTFSVEEQDQFYVYLLLKNRFRSELIQVNQEKGFANFFIYQSRKTLFWGNMSEYWLESQRMTVNSLFRNGDVKSLEIRFAPSDTPEKIYHRVLSEDNNILFSDDNGCFQPLLSRKVPADDTLPLLSLKTNWNTWDDGQKAAVGRSLPFFYVLHFIKGQLKKTNNSSLFGTIEPRNNRIRQDARTSALALARALEKSQYLCSRIRGIDASSFEIACRPEIFASEFRFLKRFVPPSFYMNLLTSQKRILPRLGISYHVGEDFLDIADGLRAMDETIRFMHLSRGDRLGHALALGISPDIHYQVKDQTIFLPKQDLLDNFVWLLYRSTEFGIVIDVNLCDEMKRCCERLLYEIYGNCMKKSGMVLTLDDYYHSWQLRGDHPDCYQYTGYRSLTDDQSFLLANSIEEKYKSCCTDDRKLDIFRKNNRVALLMYYYHYGFHERQEGLLPCQWKISHTYKKLMKQMQEAMQKMIAEKGIAIECNLSSNQLIGTFGTYYEHPLFRFNQHLLSRYEQRQHLFVSVNTDDQGVFDTSLENEYALLAECIAQKKNENNENLYNDEVIYEYIDYIRRMGLEQIFPT